MGAYKNRAILSVLDFSAPIHEFAFYSADLNCITGYRKQLHPPLRRMQAPRMQGITTLQLSIPDVDNSQGPV
jgi:hypothetical protein